MGGLSKGVLPQYILPPPPPPQPTTPTSKVTKCSLEQRQSLQNYKEFCTKVNNSPLFQAANHSESWRAVHVTKRDHCSKHQQVDFNTLLIPHSAYHQKKAQPLQICIKREHRMRGQSVDLHETPRLPRPWVQVVGGGGMERSGLTRHRLCSSTKCPGKQGLFLCLSLCLSLSLCVCVCVCVCVSLSPSFPPSLGGMTALVNFKLCLTFHQSSEEDEVFDIPVTGDQIVDHGTVERDALLHKTKNSQPRCWKWNQTASGFQKMHEHQCQQHRPVYTQMYIRVHFKNNFSKIFLEMLKYFDFFSVSFCSQWK